MLLSFTVLSPATSPISSIADFDGDGVPDDSDEFPQDPYEWKDSDGDGSGDASDDFPHDPNEISDSDGDGIGDSADFMDEGNGGVRITLLGYEFEGYLSSYNRMMHPPDAIFEIFVDIDCDGDFDKRYRSEIFVSTEFTEAFFQADCDLEDDTAAIRFTIIAYDVWDVDNNDVTEAQIMDYMPLDGVRADEKTVSLPCNCIWCNTGEGDTDTPDCALEYMISTVAL